MTFTPAQTAALDAPLIAAHVKQRKQAGRQLSYLEAWHAIAEANRIFGFGSWDRHTEELRLVSEKPRKIGDAGRDGWAVSYVAKVKIAVYGGEGGVTVRDGTGAGHGIDVDLGLAHESAIKEAESDAMKRALMTFGNPFGLALYDKTQANVVNAPAGVMTGTQLLEHQQASAGRKSSAAAKRDGDDTAIKREIAECDLDGLRTWHENFDRYTAHLPLSWLDSIRDMLQLRLEELNGANTVSAGASEMDEAFRHAVGPASPAPVAGSHAPHSPAR